jgi:dihydroorotate dehydrogenase (NAD+) catalytic subunit
MDLSLELCGIRLEHPVLNGSGTYDAIAASLVFGTPLLDDFPFSAFVSKTITPSPRAGNPPPRIFEAPAGMVNSIGLPNKGLQAFCDHDLPRLAELPVPLIVSVMGGSHDEFARLVEGVAGQPGVAALELNVSCPNVDSGLIVGQQPDETGALLRSLRPRTSTPLIVKLTPNVAQPGTVAQAAEQGGADAVSLVNTLTATAVAPDRPNAWLGGSGGGLSGPSIRAFALAQVREVAAAVSIPVIGMGGVESGRDALALVAAGATAVAVGTANFRDPMAGRRVRDGLESELRRIGLEGLSEARGWMARSTST